MVSLLLGLFQLIVWLHGHECRPNLVYILLDDVGYTDMFNANSTVPLPYMNSLLSKGIKFTNVSMNFLILLSDVPVISPWTLNALAMNSVRCSTIQLPRVHLQEPLYWLGVMPPTQVWPGLSSPPLPWDCQRTSPPFQKCSYVAATIPPWVGSGTWATVSGSRPR